MDHMSLCDICGWAQLPQMFVIFCSVHFRLLAWSLPTSRNIRVRARSKPILSKLICKLVCKPGFCQTLSNQTVLNQTFNSNQTDLMHLGLMLRISRSDSTELKGSPLHIVCMYRSANSLLLPLLEASGLRSGWLPPTLGPWCWGSTVRQDAAWPLPVVRARAEL